PLVEFLGAALSLLVRPLHLGDRQPRALRHLEQGLDRIWEAMRSCIERGLKVEGIMPGGLNVKRRARRIHDKLEEEWRSNRINPLLANDW
ncbi:hypothetical protein AB9F38_34110, partial [Rhizobium leguminosarum]